MGYLWVAHFCFLYNKHWIIAIKSTTFAIRIKKIFKMQALRQFSIPIKGLDIKLHHFTFKVDDSFFDNFEYSPYKKGDLIAKLELEKKYDNYLLDFNIQGSVRTTCDRCIAEINFPVDFSFEIIIKFDELEREEDDVIYIHPETNEINVAKYIYDNLIISMPIIKVIDCDELSPKPCDEDVLKHLTIKKENNSAPNPLGEALKGINIKTK
jgi:uncharacterized metal-binding protein YceD (DUF177 family)